MTVWSREAMLLIDDKPWDVRLPLFYDNSSFYKVLTEGCLRVGDGQHSFRQLSSGKSSIRYELKEREMERKIGEAEKQKEAQMVNICCVLFFI